MKKLLLILSLIASLFVVGAVSLSINGENSLKPTEFKLKTKNSDSTTVLQDGDIIFQISNSRQCKAVQLATNSVYSHCGIIFENNGEWVVYEAIQPVKITPFKEWVERGINSHYVVKRLKQSEKYLTQDSIKIMKETANEFLGKNYDLTFEWSDKNIYCSELVWKLYHRVLNLEVGELKKLSDFDLSNELVKKIMKERYGKKIPYNETVISPADIYESDLLIEVINENKIMQR